MSDPRPRPQYGEYASSEERLAAGGLPLEPVPPRADTLIDPSGLATPAPAPGPRRARPWDGPVAVGLLVFGALNVFSNISLAMNVNEAMEQSFSSVGFDLTGLALPDSVGVALLVSQVVIWLITAFLTVRRMRAGRTAALVPLLGGVVAAIVAAAILTPALVNDPAYMTLMSSLT